MMEEINIIFYSITIRTTRFAEMVLMNTLITVCKFLQNEKQSWDNFQQVLNNALT